MRLAFIAAAAALLAGCISITARTTVQAEPPAPYSGPLMKRSALVVADMDRAVGLYRDVLGFQLNGVTQSAPTSYSYPVFNVPTDKPIRFATFNSGPSQIRSLALLESPGVRHDASGPRESALVINANGRLRAIMAEVAKRGLPIIPERPLPGPDGVAGVEIAFTDYDGHLIVLYEFPGPPSAGEPR